ncbi:MAG TPA: autotransporter domain-containing protein [Pseudomonas sabulinigri]|uniref:Autotransporter domain-containing protein n=1 Tax=marine sediment metagenome TaxID=412755 RepID=A0A0F9VT93_9ZZZZ|nr:autotransporter domain-containing protein [Halopseudomonas sabulinigri]HEC50333.1 autotransporter domain-containing protein [Halopseudomonas sabulinigri]|tara:strand:- start:8502 stop:9434 length:933 start_codon:yes stop_codon:yes gene_type:complete
MLRKTCCAALLAFVSSPLTAAQLKLTDTNVEEKINGILSLMAYSMTLDLASSALQINDNDTGDPSLTMTQLGGGATMSVDIPLYLEGSIAYSRYDPKFVASDGVQTRTIPVKWTSLTAAGGIGWDFALNDEWVLRPIGNVALGYISSDLNSARLYLSYELDRDIEFLDDGHMSALGLGGAMMLDWERVREDYEADMELRYSYLDLQNIGGSDAISGNVTAQTANLWTRYRAPTGWTVMRNPLRYVLEYSHSEYLGEQRGALGFDRLSTVGAGIEFDSSAYPVFITRTRVLIRQMFGDGVSGTALSLAVSF